MIEVKARARSEDGLFRQLDPTQAIRSVFLRNDPTAGGASLMTVQPQNDPAPVLVERLAQAVGLVASDSSLTAPPGVRVAFGCAGLKHRMSLDNGTLTFTHVSELANVWINVLRVEIDRDWTWKGADVPTLTVERTDRFHPDGPTQAGNIGQVALLHTISSSEVQGEPERDRIIIIFIDAFSPPLWNGLPYEFGPRIHALWPARESAASRDSRRDAAPDHHGAAPGAGGSLRRPRVSTYLTDGRYAATAPRVLACCGSNLRSRRGIRATCTSCASSHTPPIRCYSREPSPLPTRQRRRSHPSIPNLYA